MCGIAGFYGFEDKKLIRQMTSLLQHRGPDQHNYYTDSTICLGHRRLSIIDLSKDGMQPMSNEDGSHQLIFNGEIYNYKELRTLLEQEGHRFKSKTDTEVIVHAYEEYGEQCVTKFNGCFAFAIYNMNTKTLFLARDRLGIKPLYYTHINGNFYFASEIKSLLASDEVTRTVNPEALNNYLSFYANPLPETMFKTIFKLLPGHTLTLKNNKIHITKYWDITMKPIKTPDSQKHLYTLLKDSVGKRLMSDVPLGVYLSGGVDSSSIVSLMTHFSDNIKTFSVGFENAKGSELSRAKIMANHFNTDHTEIHIGTDSIKHLPKIVWHQDEPMGDPTSIPTYLLSKEATKKVTVVLTGEGADEQFAGYEQEKFMVLHQKYVQKVPLSLRKSLSIIFQKIPSRYYAQFFSYMDSLGEEGKRRLIEFITTNNNTKALLSMVSIFTDKEKVEATKGSLRQEVVTNPVGKRIHETYKNTALNKLLIFENKELLTENLLMKVDKNTMAHGIEARVPFLDHRVVEFASTLPQREKLKGMKDKYILRKAMEHHLPYKRHAQKKQRFFVPIDHWLKDELQPLVEELSSNPHFNKEYIQKLKTNYTKSPLFYGRQMWTLLNFHLWYKQFIEQEKVIL
ncbi:asparagine synthase (glutamine-hydrolyzing) [Candidatus Woesearchaeota archaeon CG10_big_fil_rev_8_21_14_0_10_36_11]|nr:MAG: asparagine synthase (glutamine-hydrolyzing) [Candidatus Woesearchaeota archaeon CG10_big_fil_rev_8_21_14_0_10_36_11]